MPMRVGRLTVQVTAQDRASAELRAAAAQMRDVAAVRAAADAWELAMRGVPIDEAIAIACEFWGLT